MTRSRTTFLALTATCTALLGITTTPAQAAPVPEATAAAYVFTDGRQTEALVVEDGEIRRPMHASGFTTAHPGWDLRLSDEAGGPGLPKQDVRLSASRTETDASAGNRGFLTISDGHPTEVPLLVLNYASSGVSCSPAGVWTSASGLVRLWVRGIGNELHQVDNWSNGETTSLWNGGGPADRPYNGAIATDVKVTALNQLDQLTGYGPFAEYQGRTFGGGRGYQLEITQTEPDQVKKTYRVLVGGSAAAC
jgi:hypothetical protein